MEAKTIHRLLEYSPAEGYKRNEQQPLVCDVLIIDEASMIDLILMYNLMKAVPAGASVILVGDADQLPSVGAGNVLRDIIESACVHVVSLTRIFRQAQDSMIVLNAHRINRGEFPQLRGEKTKIFSLSRRKSRNRSRSRLESCAPQDCPGISASVPFMISRCSALCREGKPEPGISMLCCRKL